MKVGGESVLERGKRDSFQALIYLYIFLMNDYLVILTWNSSSVKKIRITF